MIFRWLLFVALASPSLSASLNELFDKSLAFLKTAMIARGDFNITFPDWKGSKIWHMKDHDESSWPRFSLTDSKKPVNISWACSRGTLENLTTVERTGPITVTPNQENNVLTVIATLGLNDLLISYKRCDFFIDGQPHKVKPPMGLKSSNNQFNFHIILKRDGKQCVSTVPEGKYKKVNEMEVTTNSPIIYNAFTDLLVEYKKEFDVKLGEKVHEVVKKIFAGDKFCDLLLRPIKKAKLGRDNILIA